MRLEKYYQIGIWQIERIDRNFYKAYIAVPSNGKITMTGSDVTTQFPVPFTHRLLSVNLYHLDAAEAESAATLEATFRRTKGIVKPTVFQETLWRDVSISSGYAGETFGEGFEREGSNYDLILNTTSGHFIVPVIYLQHLGGGGL